METLFIIQLFKFACLNDAVLYQPISNATQNQI